MNRLFAVLAAILVASACASDPALKKLAAAPLPWCNPCTYQTACTSPCAPPVVATPAPAPVPAPAPAKPAHVPPPTPALPAAFDPSPGEYKEAQQVTLSSTTAGAVIHYTTDGSTPTAASPSYTGPIAVDRDTTIRAIVTAPDVPESSISQGEYTIAPPPPPVSSSRVTVTDRKLELNEKVYFDSGKTTIKPGSLGLLDEVARVLTANSQVKKVVIEGHTDNLGKPELNTQLSRGRAQAVRDYLVTKGVAADRLEAKGFGPARPVADNKTAKGREANRRVEFVIE